jgi:hypothetical protein
MHNNCVQNVGKLGETYGKVPSLCSLSTALALPTISGLSFLRKLNTAFAHIFSGYAQKLNHFSPPYFFQVIPISHRTYYYY